MADDNNQGGTPGADNVTFEAWFEGQSDEIKSRFEQNTQVGTLEAANLTNYSDQILKSIFFFRMRVKCSIRLFRLR